MRNNVRSVYIDYDIHSYRAICAQAIKLAENKDAKEAIERGNYCDPIFNVFLIFDCFSLTKCVQHDKYFRIDSCFLFDLRVSNCSTN